MSSPNVKGSYPVLTHAGRHVVDALEACRSDGDRWATRYELARAASVSARTALRVLARLEEGGFLEVETCRYQEFGINHASRYRLIPDA